MNSRERVGGGGDDERLGPSESRSISERYPVSESGLTKFSLLDVFAATTTTGRDIVFLLG